MECKTADELLALAKSWSFEITREQAEEYIAKMNTTELTEEERAQVAGGDSCETIKGYCVCPIIQYTCTEFHKPCPARV